MVGLFKENINTEANLIKEAKRAKKRLTLTNREGVNLKTGDWIIDFKGIRKEDTNEKTGAVTEEWASYIPIFPVAILNNLSTKTEKIKIKFKLNFTNK